MKTILLFVSFLFSYNAFAQNDSTLFDIDYLSNSTVLLFQQMTPTNASVGSATILKHDKRYFSLSAQHITKELKDDSLKNYFEDWGFPINQISFTKDLPSRDAQISFLGYPIIDLKIEHFSPLTFESKLSSGLLTQNRYDDNSKKCNFVFLNSPSMQGCSGSGVYYSVKKSMFLGGDKTILIGVVHGTKGDNSGGKLAAITPSYYILDLLK